jgi:hypothetical protein
VYRAVHVGLEKSFAIKLLKTSGPPAAALERFRREAVALGRLRHPNIVEVTDFGIDGSEGSHPYIVMELLEGRLLSDVCRDRGPLPLAQALPLLEQIAAAVDAAHEAGILHRDLKPGNVFVCCERLESPRVKVLDFGLAKLLARPDKSIDDTLPFGKESPPGLTATGSLLGTPLYLAPELIRLGKPSRASDIYSFGVLAYEILGGRPPFQGTLDEVLAGHLKAVPPPLPLPPEIWRPLRAALQKDPSLRPATAGEVVGRLRKGMAEAELEAGKEGRGREVEAPRPVPFTPARLTQRTPEPSPESRRKLLLRAAVLASVVLVGTLGFLIGRRPVPSEETGGVAETRETRRPEIREANLPPVENRRQPVEPPSATAVPMSPGVKFEFDNIEEACGDLSSLSTYLCMANRGSEEVAGGARLVLDRNLATFTGHTTYRNGISLRVEGKERYSFDFGPPKGKALIPGLYTEVARWPFNDGPYPGMGVSIGSTSCHERGGTFRILQIQLTGGNKLGQFVADFETSCNGDGAIGRIALGQSGTLPEIKQRPVALASSTAPMSPGVTFAFDEIEQACGDLSSVPNYLCMVNRGSEQVAGGARLVIGEDLASFKAQASHSNSISINIEGIERYRLEFGPPKGRALVPGLYTEATRWPFNSGPYPGIDVTVGSSGCNTEDGQFRVLQILLAGTKVQRFVADFETTCNGAIGRVAVGQAGQAGPKIEIRKHE